MALTTVTPTGTKSYTVLRPICMNGDRIEAGASVELSITQYTELAAAGKVGPLAAKPEAKPEEKPAKAKAKATIQEATE